MISSLVAAVPVLLLADWLIEYTMEQDRQGSSQTFR